MTEGHAFFQDAWESEDVAPLLVYADWLEERADDPTATLLRAVIARSRTALPTEQADADLQRLREEAWQAIGQTGWPTLETEPGDRTAIFSRMARRDPRAYEHVYVLAARRALARLVVRCDGPDQVICARDHREVLRTNRLTAAGGDAFWCKSYGVEESGLRLLRRCRNVERVLAGTAIGPADLPAELVPYAAWRLCEYLCDRRRRLRAGQAVPGLHVFHYRAGSRAWRHAELLDGLCPGGAERGLRAKFLQTVAKGGGSNAAGGALVAALLVFVADDGRVQARKLVWAAARGQVHESVTLQRAGDTLSARAFGRAVAEVQAAGARVAGFPVDTPDRLRTLFRPAEDGGPG